MVGQIGWRGIQHAMNGTQVVYNAGPKQRVLYTISRACRTARAPKRHRQPAAQGRLQTFDVSGVDHTELCLRCQHDLFSHLHAPMHQAALNCDKLSCAACHLPLNDLDDVHVLVHHSRPPWARTYISSACTCPRSSRPLHTRCSCTRLACCPAFVCHAFTVRSSIPNANTIACSGQPCDSNASTRVTIHSGVPLVSLNVLPQL